MYKFAIHCWLSFLLTGFIAGSFGAEDSSKTFELRNFFNKGEILYLDMLARSEGVVTSTNDNKPTQTPLRSQMASVIAFQTIDAVTGGNATIEMRMNSMILSDESLGSATQDLVEAFGLKDRVVLIVLNAQGTIVKEQDSAETKSRVGDSIKALTRRMPYLSFPQQAIPIGFQWNESRQIPVTAASKPIIAYTTYTLDKIVEENGEKIAAIKTETQVRETDIPVDSSQSSGNNVHVVVKFTYKEYSLSSTGEIRFSLDRGRILSIEDTQDTTIHMLGSTDVDKASFVQDVLQQFKQVVTSKFTDRSPLAPPEDNGGETAKAGQ